ncbi:SH3 domain-containing protein [Lentibacillus sp.]|uniref:SH3 domain-containing protein n=1 Tax=Lentibacillus sp. TaxID=1925746 RepID=UPI002B4AFDDD|nr:SH3 domain-containing protein [Lentibacillus sp.]HLS09223.1 SH3 domain-containing protein [Lentibacillus sp.]
MKKKKWVTVSSFLLLIAALFVLAVMQGGLLKHDALEGSDIKATTNDAKLARFAVEDPTKSESKMKKKEIHINDNQDQSEDEEQEGAEKTEEPIESITKYVTVSSLNVRSGPGTDYDAVGALAINQSVDASAVPEENGWVKIAGDNLSGYVNGKYLSDDKVEVRQVNASEDSSQSTDSKETNSGKSKKSDKNENTKQPERNDADKLNTVDGNNQLILVTTNGYGTNRARVQTFERNGNGTWDQLLDVPGFIGKNGFADSKKEGDMKSPTGKYTIGTAFGRSGNPGTKLPFRGITPDDVWVDDPESELYNTWQSKQETKDQWSSAENMDIPAYTYGFVINYNTNQTPGAGSAIFFHVANSYTAGCTGVSQANVVKI